MDSRFIAHNRHSEPCKEEFTAPQTRWNRSDYVPELSMHTRPASPNKHARACTEHPQEAEMRKSWTDIRQALRGKTCGLHSRTSSGTSTPRSEKEHTTKVSTLNQTRVLNLVGSTLTVVELNLKWVLSLQREMEMLALQSAAIQSITVRVSDPDDYRWALQSPVLDLASGSGPRFPCLTALSLTCVPIPELRFAGTYCMPKLRHLVVSNEGHLLRRPAHRVLHIGTFSDLEALQILEIAVKDPLDLGDICSCSRRLRVVQLSEFWCLGLSQRSHHHIVLPAARVLVIRNSVNALELDLVLPSVVDLQLLVPGLKGLHLGPGGPAHKKHTHEGPPLPVAKLTLLRDVLDTDTLTTLGRHSQVGEIFFDDAAMDAMSVLRGEIAEALALQKGLLQNEQPEDDTPQVTSPSGKDAISAEASSQGVGEPQAGSAERGGGAMGQAERADEGEWKGGGSQGSASAMHGDFAGATNALFGLGI